MITSSTTFTLHPIEESLYYRKDVHQLLAQCEDCALFTSVEEAIAKYYYVDHFHLFIAKVDGFPVGIIGIELVEPGAALIHHLSVDDELRFRGIGSLIVQSLIKTLHLEYLEVSANELNIGFFKSLDFKVHSIRAFRRKMDQYSCYWIASE